MEQQTEEKTTLNKTIERSSNNEQKNIQNTTQPYNAFSTMGFMAAIISVIMGFYKMFAYENYDDEDYFSDYEDNVNAYVGGDAYNYIINGTYTTSYFVLALVFTVFACTMLILKEIKNK